MPILQTLGALAPFIGTGATAGLQIGAGRKNRREARHLQEQQNLANMRMAEYAYSKDLEQWYRANEYNLPKNQMARLKEAGINPATVFGHGTIAGNTQTGSTPRYNAPRIDKSAIPRDFGSLNQLGPYFDLKMRQAQTDNLNANTEKQTAEAGKVRLETAVEDIKLQLEKDLRFHKKRKGRYDALISRRKWNQLREEGERKADEFRYKASQREQQEARQAMLDELLKLELKEQKLPIPRDQMAYVVATLVFMQGMNWDMPDWLKTFAQNAGIDLEGVKRRYRSK